MKLTGNILKESARISHQLMAKKKTTNQAQKDVLTHLLHKAKKTRIGIDFDFDKILESTPVEKAFSDALPLFSYETFYARYLNQTIAGNKNIIWPGKIPYFALSSGTTANASKKIPVSDHMIKQFQKTTFEQLANLYSLDLSAEFFGSSVLTIGGSTKLTKIDNHFEGDLSGILQKQKSIFFKPYSKPSKSISKLKNWDEKMEQIIYHAPNWNIGIIAGVPTWVSMLLKAIVEHHNLSNIHEIWPNLKLYLHGGVFLDNYKEKIDVLCAHPLHYLNTFLASEGYFAYQKANVQDLQLLINHGVYYEFIEEKYFDLVNTNKHENIPTKTINEIELSKRYGLVISTCSGLWRYIVGDVISFTDLQKFSIKIEGRISQTLTTAGEHLSLENLTEAIKRTSAELQIPVDEFCVYPSKNNKRHHWYIGSQKVVNENLFAVTLNKHLESINEDYKYLRKFYLKPPKIKALPSQKFYEFLSLNDKLGGQHKFSRVMNEKQRVSWEIFLNSAFI